MRRGVLLVVTILISVYAIAQNQYLYLYRIGKSQHFKFHANESIRFKFKGDTEYLSGTITNINDSLIFFNDYYISTDTIEAVDIRHKPYHSSGLRDGAAVLSVAGIGYVFIDWFNRVVVSNEKGGLNKSVLRTAAGFLGASAILNLTRKKKFTVNDKQRIIIINPSKIKSN